MSRYTLDARHDDHAHVVVGFHQPAWTFFAQVEDRDGALVVDVGDTTHPIHDPGIALEAVRPYAPIPPGLNDQLLHDALDTLADHS